MRFSDIIAGASLAAMAIAAPLEKRVYTTEVVINVVTLTTTVFPAAEATPAPQAPAPGGFLQQGPDDAPKHKTQPAPTPTPEPAPVPSSTYVAPPPASSTPASQPPPTSGGSDGFKNVDPSKCATSGSLSTAADGSPISCGVSWLETINTVRRAYGKSTLLWSNDLATYAGNVVNTNPFHHNNLNVQISEGEIMAGTSGYAAGEHGTNAFGNAIAMWLCEVPDSPELQAGGFAGVNLCQAFGYGRGSTTEHQQILLGDYATIGCTFGSAGQVCDFK